jgi:CO/xanthine dehydrogenase FAD-binding subunit
MRPQGVALPILGMAVRMTDCERRIPDGPVQIGEIAISTGPVAPVPFRASRTEEFLRGKSVTEETLERAAQILLREVAPRTSAHRATREYRLELLPMLLRKTILAAAERVVRST